MNKIVKLTDSQLADLWANMYRSTKVLQDVISLESPNSLLREMGNLEELVEKMRFHLVAVTLEKGNAKP